MMRTIKLMVACVAVLVATVGQVQAAIITFTDRTSWEAAVVSFTTEDFNSILSDTAFTDSTLAFPDLVLGSSGGASSDILIDVLTYEFNPGTADIDGTPRVNLGGLSALSVVSITFNSPVSAAGFDTVNYDVNNDQAEAFLGSTLIGVFPAFRGQTGFIGVLDTTGTFGSITIRRESGAFDTFNAFDNVSFGSAAVPEPSSLALFGICAIGLIGYSRRKRKQAA